MNSILISARQFFNANTVQRLYKISQTYKFQKTNGLFPGYIIKKKAISLYINIDLNNKRVLNDMKSLLFITLIYGSQFIESIFNKYK